MGNNGMLKNVPVDAIKLRLAQMLGQEQYKLALEKKCFVSELCELDKVSLAFKTTILCAYGIIPLNDKEFKKGLAIMAELGITFQPPLANFQKVLDYDELLFQGLETEMQTSAMRANLLNTVLESGAVPTDIRTVVGRYPVGQAEVDYRLIHPISNVPVLNGPIQEKETAEKLVRQHAEHYMKLYAKFLEVFPYFAPFCAVVNCKKLDSNTCMEQESNRLRMEEILKN
jgi:hypothetical protein